MKVVLEMAQICLVLMENQAGIRSLRLSFIIYLSRVCYSMWMSTSGHGNATANGSSNYAYLSG